MPPQVQPPVDPCAAPQALRRLRIASPLAELLLLMAWVMLAEALWSRHIRYLSGAERTLAYLVSLAAGGVALPALLGLLAIRRGILIARLTGRAPKDEIGHALKIASLRALLAAGGIAFTALSCHWLGLWTIPLVLGAAWFWARPDIRRPPRKSASAPPPNEGDEDRVLHLKQLAGRMGMENVSVRITDSLPFPTLAACEFVNGRADWVYLSKTSLALLDDREMMAILAHEVAHCRLGHARSRPIVIAATFSVWLAALTGLILGSPGVSPAEWGFLPGPPRLFLAMSILSLLTCPITAAISRRSERAANRLALKLSGDPAAFLSAARKLAESVGATGRVSGWERWLVATHPSLQELTEQARQFAQDKGIPLEGSAGQ
ncbi:MAG: M48 family metalloprotease [Phycisphaerae bacterium]|nr:M48 family metalloprotease [Phycisphaerae bacterium]